jgi:hypothetical protein
MQFRTVGLSLLCALFVGEAKIIYLIPFLSAVGQLGLPLRARFKATEYLTPLQTAIRKLAFTALVAILKRQPRKVQEYSTPLLTSIWFKYYVDIGNSFGCKQTTLKSSRSPRLFFRDCRFKETIFRALGGHEVNGGCEIRSPHPPPPFLSCFPSKYSQRLLSCSNSGIKGLKRRQLIGE